MIEVARRRHGTQRQRASSWDRTGGNADAYSLLPGASQTLLDVEGPGAVTHLWFTLQTPNLYWARDLVLRAWWDGATHPSIVVPFGDFLGVGNAIPAAFDSAGLSIAPRDGTALHCWLPMPFATGARITVDNDSDLPVTALYAYVDWEQWSHPRDDLGRLHATWNRTRGPAHAAGTQGGEPLVNLTDEHNHRLATIEGGGHYVGTVLSIHNADGGWYGEGDDMFVVDGEPWPPRLHGTGTEDYVGTAWSPAERFWHRRYGQPLAESPAWDGFSTVYRWHLDDPIAFRTSLRASIERGHANDRADDLTSVAYWYGDHARAVAPLPELAERRPPWPPRWQARAQALRAFWHGVEGPLGLREGLALATCARAAARWDEAEADRSLAALGVPLPPAPAPPPPPVTARALAGEAVDVDALLGEWARGVHADRLARTDVTVGLVIDGAHRRLVLREGQGSVTHEPGPERLRLEGSARALAGVIAGRDDPVEAVLTGEVRVSGAADVGLALPRWFLLDVASTRSSVPVAAR